MCLFSGYLAYEFNKFWIQEEPESIMEFNLYREKFHEKVKRLLLDPDVTLILNLDSTNWLKTDQWITSHTYHFFVPR